MTCQLVLFNGHGVVLASDSAVTMGSSRVYDTAEKIAALPDPHQVALLVSGSDFLHQFPMQVLIHEYSKSLGSQRLSTAADYCGAFVRFIEESSLFSDEIQRDFLVDLIDQHLSDLRKAIDHQYKIGGRGEEQFLRAVTHWRNWYLRYELNRGASEEWFWSLVEDLSKDFWELLTRHFHEGELNDSTRVEVVAEISDFLMRAPGYRNTTNLSFAGYGENEVLPSYASISVFGYMGNRLLYWPTDDDRFDATRDGRWCGVKLIAQTEAIETFIRGSSMETHESARSIFRETMGRITETVTTDGANPGTDSSAESLIKQREEIRSNAEQKLEELGREREELFKDVIAGLPPATLATVAESLIGIQSLSQAVTAKLNTVGGPIDTAMITRANGFQWIRHKSISG